MTLQLSGDTVTHVQSGQGIDEYTATQEGDSGTVDHIVVGRSGNRFLIAVGSSREAARTLFDRAVAEAPAWRTLGAHDSQPSSVATITSGATIPG